MTPRSTYTATRAPYNGLRPAYEALMRKKDASLSGGAYARDPRPGVVAVVHASNRSRFAPLIDGMPGEGALGMGVVQAYPGCTDRLDARNLVGCGRPTWSCHDRRHWQPRNLPDELG